MTGGLICMLCRDPSGSSRPCPENFGRHHFVTVTGADGAAPSDPVNAPAHYKASAVEPIAAIEAWQLSFCLGNVVKYIARAAHKGALLEDLKKARWYLDREIARLEASR